MQKKNNKKKNYLQDRLEIRIIILDAGNSTGSERHDGEKNKKKWRK